MDVLGGGQPPQETGGQADNNGQDDRERLRWWYEEQRLQDFCWERDRLYRLLLWEQRRSRSGPPVLPTQNWHTALRR